MTRNEFLSRLRRGLDGLAPDQVHDVMGDYETHFIDGLANGRTEEEIAAALGDPARLARELKAEAGFRRWENDRTAGNLAGAVLALLGLAAVDVMFLLPFLFALGGMFIGCAAAAIGLLVAGFALILGAAFPGLAFFGWSGMSGVSLLMAAGLAGLGLMAIGVGLGALFWLALNFTVKAMVEYARLHFRLINKVTE
jgi:uncharacterized membrane protein